MARPMGSGPIHIFIGFGPPLADETDPNFPPPAPVSSALYYGTTRAGPDITEQLAYYPVMNDITGPQQSMDDGFAGREDMIGLAMTSWDQDVEDRLEHFLDQLSVTNPIGTDEVSDLGTLMVSEGMTVGIWLLKAAATKAINVASGMALGRYYPTCILVGPSQIIEGNKENMMVRAFKAKKDINQLNAGKLPLFMQDNASFAGLLAKVNFG